MESIFKQFVCRSKNIIAIIYAFLFTKVVDDKRKNRDEKMKYDTGNDRQKSTEDTEDINKVVIFCLF